MGRLSVMRSTCSRRGSRTGEHREVSLMIESFGTRRHRVGQVEDILCCRVCHKSDVTFQL